MKFNDLPKKIAIFPLSNAIFFPRTVLPLNIFENRYLHLVNDCLKNQRIFGMIQPKIKKNNILEKELKTELYHVGCLGRITSFSETSDGRLIITLLGLSRFSIMQEISNDKLYREFNVDYSSFTKDLIINNLSMFKTDIINLINKTKIFFRKKNYLIDWDELKKLDFEQLINTICMISPLSVEEKQKLLETVKNEDKFKNNRRNNKF